MPIACDTPLQELLIDSALRLRLRFASFVVASARKGVLFSYASDIHEGYRKAARYVDGILKGAKPADMPIEQPARFELVVNLRTGRAADAGAFRRAVPVPRR
jgi:putative ABC transport system substrate-binding protein